MDIKIRLSKRKEWDREIIKWLKTIPSGYRSTKVKEKLYQAISSKEITIPESAHPSSSEPRSPLDEKISKLVKM